MAGEAAQPQHAFPHQLDCLDMGGHHHVKSHHHGRGEPQRGLQRACEGDCLHAWAEESQALPDGPSPSPRSKTSSPAPWGRYKQQE